MLYPKLKVLVSLGWRNAVRLVLAVLSSRFAGVDLHSLRLYKEYSNLLFLANHRVCFKRTSDLHIMAKVKLNGKEIEVTLRTLDSDVFVFHQIFIMKEYEPLVKLYNNFIGTPARVIVDAGSNIGLSALYLASNFPQATVFCLEPDDSNFELLKTNTAAYPDKNFVYIKKALWSDDRQLSFERGFRDQHSWSIKVNDITTDDLPTTGISARSLLEQLNLFDIDLFKIDIEGSESAVFSQEAQPQFFLERTKCLAIEIHNELADEQLITDIISRTGFFCKKEGETVLAYNRLFSTHKSW